MKRIMLLLVLWISVAGLATAKQPPAKPDDETAVRALADAYLAAYNRGDAKNHCAVALRRKVFPK